jgi:hypothetical protein
VGFGFLVLLRFASRSLAMWRVCAIALSFVSGWRAFSSVSLCNYISYDLTQVLDLYRPFSWGLLHAAECTVWTITYVYSITAVPHTQDILNMIDASTPLEFIDTTAPHGGGTSWSGGLRTLG